MIAARLGKMPTTSVRRRISLFRRSCGLLDQIWRQISWGKQAKASRSSRAASRCSPASANLTAMVSTTRPNWEDGAHHGGDPGLGRLGHLREQVPEVVGAAALPGGTAQGGADGVDQAA